MSSPRVFITGVSGYIGGHTLLRLIAKHANWTIVVLVRDTEQKAKIQSIFPSVEVVIGTLDDSELMISEGSKADVVLQTASADHIRGVLALIKGLGQKEPNPGRFIHVSGTGMLNEVPNGFGNPSDKVYHDTTDLVEITSLPIENRVHRDVDLAVLSASKKFNVPTAIISPPTIHGVGKGPLKTRSLQIPFLIEAILKRGRGFQILEGQNIWDQIHIDDVTDAFILLAEEAVKPDGGNAQWGEEGYYFAENGHYKWGDVVQVITKELATRGAIASSEVDKVSVEDAMALHPWAPLLWGGNCRSRADRLEALGWKAKRGDVFESLPEMVAVEIKNFGKESSKTTFDK